MNDLLNEGDLYLITEAVKKFHTLILFHLILMEPTETEVLQEDMA